MLQVTLRERIMFALEQKQVHAPYMMGKSVAEGYLMGLRHAYMVVRDITEKKCQCEVDTYSDYA